MRPEFIDQAKTPSLNSNAFSPISNSDIQVGAHRRQSMLSTQVLLDKVRVFAEDLAKSNVYISQEGHQYNNVISHMHQNGINTRHIGLLRCQFWRKINGSVHLSSGSPIVCTHFNILYTGIQPGYKVRFGADVTRYVISKEQYYPNKFRLEQRFRGKSSLHADLYVGNISNDDNCDLIRSTLLVEMVARVVKHLTRASLRYVARLTRGPVLQVMQQKVICMFLNALTGASSNTQMFWSEFVFEGIRSRFGHFAVQENENVTLFDDLKHVRTCLIRRFCNMMHISLAPEIEIAFCNSPEYFHFVEFSDVQRVQPVVKDNFFNYYFSKAILLFSEYKDAINKSYESVVNKDHPLIFWSLMKKEHNVFKWPINFEFVEKDMRNSAPVELSENLSIELWASVMDGRGTNRVAASISKRAALIASRDEHWAFVIILSGKCINLIGPPIVYQKMQHFICVCSGNSATFYVDGIAVDWSDSKKECIKKAGGTKPATNFLITFFESDVNEMNQLDVKRNSIYKAKSSVFAVGFLPSSLKHPNGSNFFLGLICYVSVYNKGLNADDVRKHRASTFERILEHRNRLSVTVARHFESAMCIAPNNDEFAKSFRSFMVELVSHGCTSQEELKTFEKSIKCFFRLGRLFDIFYIMRDLPHGNRLSNLVCSLYDSILERDMDFFSNDAMTKELALLSMKFDLMHQFKEKNLIQTLAGIIRHVVSYPKFACFYGKVNLHWLLRMKSDEAVLFVIRYVICHEHNKLGKFDLTNVDILPNDIQLLASQLPDQITSFAINDCEFMTDEAFQSICKAGVRLQHMSVKNCTMLVGNSFKFCATSCTQLVELDIQGCNGIREINFIHLIENCTKVKVLNLKGCNAWVSDQLLSTVATLPLLISFNVACCVHITDGGLKSLFSQGVLSLVDLDLSSCTNLTDNGIRFIGKYCPKLRYAPPFLM